MTSPRPLVIGALLLLALAAAGCDEDTTPAGLDSPVTDDGPFRAGYRTIEITYTPPFAAEPRTIDVAIWYPTTDERITSGPDKNDSPIYGVVVRDPETIVDASLAPSAYEGGYPVLVHSHGHLGFPGNSYLLLTAMARQGWVVVAPAHVGDTLDGGSASNFLSNWLERPLDISATLDALEALPSSDPLAGKLSLERVMMSGHSRGTFTVWAILGARLDPAYVQSRCDAGEFDEPDGCTAEELEAVAGSFRDERVIAGIPMAGDGGADWYGRAAGMGLVTAPVLMMSGSADPVGADALYDELSSVDLTWIDIEGGCHQLFGFGLCEGISDDVGQPIVRTYALAFSRRHLLGDDDATVLGVLDGTYAVSDLVSFHP
jgi:predicted dienelactone hydrolase